MFFYLTTHHRVYQQNGKVVDVLCCCVARWQPCHASATCATSPCFSLRRRCLRPRPDQVIHGRLMGNVYSGNHRKAARCEQAARCLRHWGGACSRTQCCCITSSSVHAQAIPLREGAVFCVCHEPHLSTWKPTPAPALAAAACELLRHTLYSDEYPQSCAFLQLLTRVFCRLLSSLVPYAPPCAGLAHRYGGPADKRLVAWLCQHGSKQALHSKHGPTVRALLPRRP